jgi:hypothetical protein
MLFVVDTGSSHGLILSERVCQRLKLKPSPAATTKINGVTCPVLGPNKFTWEARGKTESAFVRAVVAPAKDFDTMGTGDDREPIAGVIGMPLLQGSGLTINFDNKLLTLRHQPMTARPAPVAKIPVALDEASRRYSVRLRLDPETEVSALLDTGTYHSTINDDETGTPEEADMAPLELDFRLFLIEKSYSAPLYLLHGVGFVAEDARQPAYVEEDLNALLLPEFPNLLGLSWLSRFNFDLDHSGKTLTIFRRRGGGRQIPGMIGVEIQREAGTVSSPRWKITRVYRGEPGAKAGLRVGDRILSVDGTAPPWSSEKAYLLVNGFAGDTARVRVERAGGKPITLSVPREPNLVDRPSTSPDFGGVWQWQQGWDAVTLSSVEEGGALAKAGLREGDKLFEINGIPVAELSAVGWFRELKKATQVAVPLRYRRGTETGDTLLRISKNDSNDTKDSPEKEK